MNIPSPLAQIEMRITDQLSRAVISDIASPVGLNQFDGFPGGVFPSENVVGPPCSSHRKNVGMFEQIDGLGLSSMEGFLECLFLLPQALLKRSQTQVYEPHGIHCSGSDIATPVPPSFLLLQCERRSSDESQKNP
jgi:hypothetical protein